MPFFSSSISYLFLWDEVVLRGVALCVNGLLASGLEQRFCLDFNQCLLVVEEWVSASYPSLRA
jgi:hypothetical protein